MKKGLITAGLVTSLVCTSILVEQTAFAASKDNGQATVTKQVNKSAHNDQKAPRDIGIVTKGELNISGTGANGLKLQGNNTVTTGTLDLHYVGKSIGIGIDEQTEIVFSVPKELQEVVNSPNFNNYVTGIFKFNNGSEHTYDPHDIRVEDNGATIRVINPTESWFIGANFDVKLNIDLGQLVTDTGIRIPDAENNSSYYFNAGLIKKGDVIDWDLIGNYNAGYTLPTHQLDPGWTLINEKPTVEDVYDSDEVVTGKGVPGAKVQVKVRDEVIGTGTVDENGIYEVKIPKQSKGVTLTISQNTGVGWSDPITTVVKHKEESIPKPTVNEPVTSSDTQVKGTGYEAGNTIIVTDSNGKELGRGLVQSDKSFSVDIPAQDAYTILHVVETNGTETSPATEVTVHEGESKDGKITGLDKYSISNNDGYIHGTYTGSAAAQVNVVVDGVKGSTVPLEPGNGQFKYYIANLVSTPGQNVTVNLLDASGNVLDSKNLEVVA